MNIGIDIGGSHIGIGLVDSDGKVLKKEEHLIKTSDRIDIKSFLEREIISTLKRWNFEDGIEVRKIGIGCPGIVKDNQIKYSVNLGLKNYDLKSYLQEEFPNAEIKIKNDAKCAALAEKNLGTLKKFDDAIFLCLGTGIGGAAFYGGKLICPSRSSGFEYGHMIIEKDGELCRCGSKGCFEQYGSMRKFKNNIRYNLNLPAEFDGEELLNIVKKNLNSKVVKNIIEEYIQNLCIGISNIVNIIEPQAICLGGGFAYYKDILLEKFKEEFYSSDYIFYKEDLPEILIANLGNDAGIIGSALYID